MIKRLFEKLKDFLSIKEQPVIITPVKRPAKKTTTTTRKTTTTKKASKK